ncbi:YbjN domain-containing protein [Roseospirillum parvum]|uniref:Sensory transduction regulator n=1 Tax=Roseospirillum parvum TaxID=83401 RepID=A0A1G8A1V5_9PROT|nr:YbjN domain-containing protein [Roseospirillum parvum]SDH14460.1 hypothetical protein SAMN05421742_104282 [Roseospirillum parvum]
MTASLAGDFDAAPTANPIDHVEQVATHREWAFDRRSDQEVAIEVPGQWCDLGLFFAYSEDLSALHFSAAFDLRVPKGRRQAVYELLAHLNEKLWMGHFAIWIEEGIPMFRHTVNLIPGAVVGAQPDGIGQGLPLEDLVDVAISECERFYPAFQFVIWGGKTAEDAIAAAMLDTVGEA